MIKLLLLCWTQANRYCLKIAIPGSYCNTGI